MAKLGDTVHYRWHTVYVTRAERPRDVVQPTEVTLEVDWSAVEDVQTLPVNQMLAQVGPGTDATGVPDGVYLTFGHAAPPVLLGSQEAIRRGLEQLDGRLKVDVHGRYFLTRDRLAELIRILQTTSAQLDIATPAASRREDSE